MRIRYVLTAGYWPAYQPVEVNLPKEVAEYQEVFKKLYPTPSLPITYLFDLPTYLAKYSGRRLTWQNSLGFCVVRALFPLGKKELSVSLFQSVVLALFNEAPETGISFKEIQEASGTHFTAFHYFPMLTYLQVLRKKS